MKAKTEAIEVPVEIDLEKINAAVQKAKELKNTTKEAARYAQKITFTTNKLQWITLGISIFSLIISFISFLNKQKGEKKLELKDNVFYTPAEFAELRGCNVDTARTIFNVDDFPSENYGKEKVALGSAIREWYSKKRKKGD